MYKRQLLTGRDDSAAREKLSLTGRLAAAAGRLSGISADPRKLREASRAYMPVGKSVVVIGGGLVGCELADFLAERGRSVVVLEEGPVLAVEMAHPRRWRVLHELREAGVRLVSDATPLEIGPDFVRFRAPEAPGEESLEEQIPADTVVLATGLADDPSTASAFERTADRVLRIGDIGGVGYIEGAIRDGFEAALDL